MKNQRTERIAGINPALPNGDKTYRIEAGRSSSQGRANPPGEPFSTGRLGRDASPHLFANPIHQIRPSQRTTPTVAAIDDGGLRSPKIATRPDLSERSGRLQKIGLPIHQGSAGLIPALMKRLAIGCCLRRETRWAFPPYNGDGGGGKPVGRSRPTMGMAEAGNPLGVPALQWGMAEAGNPLGVPALQ